MQFACARMNLNRKHTKGTTMTDTPNTPNEPEIEAFKAQLAAGTDAQVQSAFYNEAAAGREAYITLIKAEAGKRGITLLDCDGEIVPNFEPLRREVPERARMACLPRHFGRYMMQFESAVYEFMRMLCPGDPAKNGEGRYSGGFWKYYELSNGAFYMAPDDHDGLMYVVSENGASEQMTPDGAGVVACLHAMSHLSFANDGKSDNDKMIDHYHLLREIVSEHHPEARAILRIIN